MKIGKEQVQTVNTRHLDHVISRRLRKYRSILIALFALLLLLPTIALAASAQPQTTPHDPADDWERVQQAGVLVLGTAADYPPFEFYNSNHELDGFDIALAKALGAVLGIEVKYNDFAFDGLLNEVQLGQVDGAIAAISVTSERQKIVDFSSLYYLGSSSVVASADFTETITSPTDFADLRVGVQRGTTYQSWAQQQLVATGLISQTDLFMYGTAGGILADLRSGDIDVGLMGEQPATIAVRNGDLKIVGEQINAQRFALAFPRGSSLVAPINEALIELRDSGIYAQLVKNYLNMPLVHVAPPAAEAVIANLPLTTTATTPAPSATLSSTTPACLNSMAWVSDLNLDDHDMKAPPVVLPGQDFTKGWRVRNSGTCTWPADYRLAYVSGNRIEAAMGGTSVSLGKEVAPGEEIDLSVNLRAPQVYGTFQGFWKMQDEHARNFGEVIWVGVQVPNPNPPPTPTPAPLPTVAPQPTPVVVQPAQPAVQQPVNVNPNLRADQNVIAAGQCTTIRWDVDNVNAVFLIDPNGQQGVGGHDARNECPGVTTTFTLRVVNHDNSSHDYQITLQVTPNNNYSINFGVDNGTIDSGQCTHLRWDVRNVQAVYLNGEGVAGVSDREVCPGSTQTYELRVTRNDGGQESRQVTINVNAPQPQTSTEERPSYQALPAIDDFSVDNNYPFIGECINLNWSTENTDSVNIWIDGNLTETGGPSSGSLEECQLGVGVHLYEMYAYNGSGQTQTSVSVTVQDAGD